MVEFKRGLNPFIPEFLKWTLPSLNLDMCTDEPSHVDLHCLHRSAGLNDLTCSDEPQNLTKYK